MVTPSNHVQRGGQAAVQQRVVDHAAAVGKHGGVVLQRVGVGQRAEAPHLGKAQQQHADVRRKGQQQDEADPGIGRHRSARAQPAPLDAAAALLQRAVVAALQRAGAQRHRGDGKADHDDADDVAQRVFQPDLRDAQIGLRRQQVGLAHHQRRAQVVEHLHEDQRGAGHEARCGQRKDHAPEQPPAGAAQVHGRFFHRAVDVAQRHRQVHQDERKVVDRLDEDHAVEPFHDGQREAEVLLQQQVHAAAAAEDQLQRHRAHEGRHDQRQHAQGLDQDRTAEFEAHREVGQRHGDQRGEDTADITAT
jgi:hypothetical protein